MAKRFVDNVTPLNAETLNQFEEDLKHSVSIPVYNAVFEENENGGYKAYRIADVEWNDIPVGGLFSVILDKSTKSDEEVYVGLRFGQTNDSAWYIFYSAPDYSLGFPDAKQVKTGSRKYLRENTPYTIKKLATAGSTTPLIVILDHFDTTGIGSRISVDGEKLQLKNSDGTVISEVPVMNVMQENIQIQVEGTVLNIITK